MRPIVVSKRIKISLELADSSNLWLDFKGKSIFRTSQTNG